MCVLVQRVLAKASMTECVSEACFHWMHEWISFYMAVCECVISDRHHNNSFHLCFCISSQKSEQQSHPRPEKWLLRWLVLPREAVSKPLSRRHHLHHHCKA